MRAGFAFGIVLALAVGCAEQAPENPAPADEAATSENPAPAATPEAAAGGSAATVDTGSPAAAQDTGALETAPDVLAADPELARDAAPPGRATARWGVTGRDVGGKSPWRSVAYDGIHDRASDAIGLLQEPRTALRSLPRGRSGNLVDWAAALNDGAIRPRARVGSQGAMEELDLDILFADTKNMPVVMFPHITHTRWLSCGNCHEWLFKAQAGANNISMTDIARGRYCGLCHGKVAFPATDCFRCHNGPRPQG